ncbi:ribbon-helix-helix domain-containing protein [Acidianus manzaensis]|uniref:Ribbon-helix-helix protein CopG domain-containing protein n=1 Tax=Acidianus manzaensis TaxID=282676 RepID=A0A1W6K1W2_9CREN|nr:ribbon-helix-helix domain-containing protein [Acidianus manzaensis]ARM76378.1 hypothetical protein B6F84_10340 [Acidianus manzaensis]ARM76424.1 hypothetical protein B6F84_10610 [Acidianus manzaensis]
MESLFRVRKLSDTEYELIPFKEQETISFKITEEELKAIDQIAKQLGMTKSDLIRKAIYEFLKREGML